MSEPVTREEFDSFRREVVEAVDQVALGLSSATLMNLALGSMDKGDFEEQREDFMVALRALTAFVARHRG